MVAGGVEVVVVAAAMAALSIHHHMGCEKCGSLHVRTYPLGQFLCIGCDHAVDLRRRAVKWGNHATFRMADDPPTPSGTPGESPVLLCLAANRDRGGGVEPPVRTNADAQPGVQPVVGPPIAYQRRPTHDSE